MVDPRSGTKLKVLVFAASLRADSLNRKLAALAARVAERNGAVVELTSMRDFDVPSFDGDVAVDERPVRLGEREHVRVDPRAEVLERHAQCPEPPIAAHHGR